MRNHRITTSSFVVLATLLAGCGGSTTTDLGSNNTGGSTSSGGTSSAGGSGNTGTGGSGVGGQGTGGQAQGGQSTGGHATGGHATGGQATGGHATGGQSTGGQSTGGQATGGHAQGGNPQGGSPQGGQSQGGSGPDCCSPMAGCPGGECVSGVCKSSPPLGSCWEQSDCDKLDSGPFTCTGATVCPCGGLCDVPDMLGQCVYTGGTGGAGGSSSCCTDDKSCGDLVPYECVSGVCKQPLPPGQCWRDSDCAIGPCNGVEVCGCNVVCGPMDVPGQCGGGTGGTGGGGNGCCMGAGDCNPGDECVNTVCKPKPPSGDCWSDMDCEFPGGGIWMCQAGFVCPCAGDCAPADHTGKCIQIPFGACPPDPPANGSSCNALEGQYCEYGSDLRTDTCRQHATCSNGTWSVPIGACAPLPGPGQSGCPKDPTTANGTSCSMASELCDEGGGVLCGCGICQGGVCQPDPTPTWSCVVPSGGVCPAVAPDIGQPCMLGPDVECDYGMCNTPTHTGRACQNNVWVKMDPPCPL